MVEECVEYFKQRKAYKRIFDGMRKKWMQYGTASGYVILENPTEDERAAVSDVIGKPYHDERVKFQMGEFEKALQETKFKGTSLRTLLEGYFGETLISNKQRRNQRLEAKQAFFDEALADFTENAAVWKWLAHLMRTKENGYGLLSSAYEKDPIAAKAMIMHVCDAVGLLRKNREGRLRLAALSALITKNPHYFDRESIAGKLLLHVLCFDLRRKYPQDAESALELYYLSGIQTDDISSYTTAYGIRLYTDQGIHPAYEHFIREDEMYVIALSNLAKIRGADCSGKHVYVVENQMVFSQMCEDLAGENVSMLCTSGQMKTASLILIDLLCASGCTLYYSGDIDPEGLVIADKLLARHPLRVLPWRLSDKDYKLSQSNVRLEDERIKKLDKVGDPRLQAVVKRIRDERKAGYQELLQGLMLADIKARLTSSPKRR